MRKINYFLGFLVLITFLHIFFINSKISKDKVAIAINCGGPSFVDSDGIHYEKDKYFDAGVSSDYGLNYDIDNAKDMEVYQTERWHSDSFSYSIPLKQNGKYVLILKFSEVYFNQPGDKVFDIALGKKIIVKDLDIFAKVGKASAHDEYIEFELRDDQIYLNKSQIQGAYDASNKALKVSFLKGQRDNPKINAMLIYRGDIMETDYAEKKKQVEDSNRKKMQELKKKYLIELKHHPDEPYDEEAALAADSEDLFNKDDGGLVQIFTNIEGSLIILSFTIFLAINYALDLGDSKTKVHGKNK